MDKYLSYIEFNELKAHATELCPNPNVFKVGKNRYQLACSYTIEKLDNSGALWYAGREGDFCILTFENGFAPDDIVAKIVNKRYTDNPDTGYIFGRGGNLGTGAMVVETSKLAIIKNILNKNNFYQK